MANADFLTVRAAPRAPARLLAAAGLALLSGWMLYTIPPARARAAAALHHWLGPVMPAEAEIKFGEVRARRETVNGQTVLYVEGSLLNSGARARKTPTLRVALIGDDGRPVYSWNARPAKPELEAAHETPFQTRLLAPPEKFKNIAISVADEG